MSLILSGTNGLSDVDGTAATPAIRGTDANTGIFFPAADTIAFAEGGVEAMRLDSAGNLSLGDTSTLGAVGYKCLRINGSTGGLLELTSGTTRVLQIQSDGASAGAQITTISNGSNPPLIFGTNSVERMRIDASGNLGLGTTSLMTGQSAPSATISGPLSVAGYLAAHQTSKAVMQYNNGQASLRAYGATAGTGYWSFNVGGGGNSSDFEAMRIDTSGNLLVGTTLAAAKFYISSSSGVSATNARFDLTSASLTVTNVWSVYTGAGNNTNNFRHFAAYSGDIGQDCFRVYGQGNVVNINNSYGALSDVKLKENIVDATPKLADLMQVKVRNYNLKSDPSHKQLGVIAQELETVFPALIEESPDVDLKGNDLGTTTKQVKYSVFVPMLIKAIQELKAELDTVKAELAAMKGTA